MNLKNTHPLKKSHPTPAMPPLIEGTSILNYTDHTHTPMQRVATQPKQTIICHTVDDFQAIHPIINASLDSNTYWVIATTYEWGVSQQGIITDHPTAIFLAYDDVCIHPLPLHMGHPLPHPITMASSWDADRFTAAIDRVKSAIIEGDMYQMNLSYPSEIQGNTSIDDIYHHMMHAHAPQHGAYIHAGPWKIASCSPEELFYLHHGRIRTRPIKGTIGRHSDPVADANAYRTLANSTKDIAELTMITDLMRNDLSQCARPGSVKTTVLNDIVPFNYVYHLMATIEADMSPNLSPLDTLIRLAPGGSITGCPKPSASAYIQVIESGPRRFYTGHIGFIHGHHDAAFNVAIRTCYQQNDGPIMTHTGCGITIDSDPVQEYIESQDKLRFLMSNPHAH